MSHVRSMVAMLFVVLLAVACSDAAPTAPTGIAVGPNGPSTYVLEPVIVVGKCDPYMSLDWCGGSNPGDGDCMTNAADAEAQYTSGCYTGGGGGPIGPGGGTTTPTTCDPAIHPNCEKPLTDADRTTIANALATQLRPAEQFTDSIARRQCAELEAGFRTALAAGAVFRGAFDSDNTNDPYGSHYGMYNNGNIHYDPAGLDAANAGNTAAVREVAITALHEAAHRMGYSHPTAPTFDTEGRDYYTDSPFNRLNPGPNSCVPR